MALERLRKLSKSPIVAVVLGLVALSFVLVGTNSGSSIRATANRAVATVGGEPIGIQKFANEYERQRDAISSQIGQAITPEMARQMGLVDQALGILINRTALQKHARSLGVVGSSKAVKRELFKIKAFQGGDQKFDENQYKLVLASNRIDRKEFEANMRTDVVVSQMFDLMASGITPPKGMAELYLRYQAETRGANYIILSPDLVGPIEDPGDEVLKDFYDANAAMFSVPEMRKITYLDIKPDDFMASVNVTEEDIKALYERTEASYITPESRMIKEIYGTEDVIKGAKARIDAGESFNDVAESLGFKPQEYNLGSVTEKAISDKAVADVVFAMTEPGITDPIQGGLSWSLVELQEIEPEVVRTLDDVHDELYTTLAERSAQDMVFETLEIVEEDIASGALIEEIGNKVGVPVTVIENITRDGNGPDGQPVAGLPDSDKFLEEAFSTVVGFASDVMEVSGNDFFTLQVDEITPTSLKPFETVRADALAAWRKVQRENKLEELAKSLTERGNAGEQFAALGDEIGRGVLTVPTAIQRGEPTDLISAGINRQLFSAKEGQFVYGALPEGDGLIVAELTVIDTPNTASAGSIIDSLQAQMGTQMSNDMQDLYVMGLMARYPVKRNEVAINQVIGLLDPAQ